MITHPVIRVKRLVLGIVAGCLILAACKPGSQDGVALVGATLIDGTGGPPLADAAVLVRRGKVESIGPRSGFELPRGVNASRTVLAGQVSGCETLPHACR